MTEVLRSAHDEGTQGAALFVGRDREVREITAFLSSNQSVSLIGLPGMGKSALLQHLGHPAPWQAAGLASTGILYAYVDGALLHTSTPAEMFGCFAAALTLAVEASGLPPAPALAATLTQPSRLAFEAAVRQLNGRGLQVVLALDAFEQISNNPQLGVAFFNALRAVAARFALVFLTASARPLMELTEGAWALDLLSSPFFNIFAPVFLGPLEEEDARQLLRALLRAAPEGTVDLAEGFLYDLVGGSPLALRIACHHTMATPGDHGAIVQRTMHALRDYYSEVWHALTPSEQALQQHSLDSSLRQAPGDPAVRAVLHSLARKGVLVTEGASFRYAAHAWARFIAPA